MNCKRFDVRAGHFLLKSMTIRNCTYTFSSDAILYEIAFLHFDKLLPHSVHFATIFAEINAGRTYLLKSQVDMFNYKLHLFIVFATILSRSAGSSAGTLANKYR